MRNPIFPITRAMPVRVVSRAMAAGVLVASGLAGQILDPARLVHPGTCLLYTSSVLGTYRWWRPWEECRHLRTS